MREIEREDNRHRNKRMEPRESKIYNPRVQQIGFWKRFLILNRQICVEVQDLVS